MHDTAFRCSHCRKISRVWLDTDPEPDSLDVMNAVHELDPADNLAWVWNGPDAGKPSLAALRERMDNQEITRALVEKVAPGWNRDKAFLRAEHNRRIASLGQRVNGLIHARLLTIADMRAALEPLGLDTLSDVLPEDLARVEAHIDDCLRVRLVKAEAKAQAIPPGTQPRHPTKPYVTRAKAGHAYIRKVPRDLWAEAGRKHWRHVFPAGKRRKPNRAKRPRPKRQNPHSTKSRSPKASSGSSMPCVNLSGIGSVRKLLSIG